MTMDTPWTALFPAFVVGLSIAAPVGPIGLLTIQRTLERGRLAGLATGLGAATADACYGAIGAYGVHWLVGALVALRLPLAIGGGLLLLWMAVQTWRSPVAETAAHTADARGMLGLWAGTFLLTLSNPMTIVSFVAVFGMLGAGAGVPPAAMVVGVFAGSAAWWLMLTSGVQALRGRLGPALRRGVNRVSAAVLAGFALWQGLSLLRT